MVKPFRLITSSQNYSPTYAFTIIEWENFPIQRIFIFGFWFILYKFQNSVEQCSGVTGGMFI